MQFISQIDGVLLLVRLILALIMIYYGLPKILDLKANSSDFVDMGFRPGWLWGTIVALTEFVGGILMIFGVLVPLVALAFGFEMLMGALWKMFSEKKPFEDYSYDIILLGLSAVSLVFGAGSYTVFALF